MKSAIIQRMSEGHMQSKQELTELLSWKFQTFRTVTILAA